MLNDDKKSLLLKTIEENQGITKSDLKKQVINDQDLSAELFEELLVACQNEKTIRAIRLDGEDCLYLNGTTKSNQVVYKNRTQKMKLDKKSLLVLFLVLLCIALAIVFPGISYFAVILLIGYCFFTWLFKP